MFLAHHVLLDYLRSLPVNSFSPISHVVQVVHLSPVCPTCSLSALYTSCFLLHYVSRTIPLCHAHSPCSVYSMYINAVRTDMYDLYQIYTSCLCRIRNKLTMVEPCVSTRPKTVQQTRDQTHEDHCLAIPRHYYHNILYCSLNPSSSSPSPCLSRPSTLARTRPCLGTQPRRRPTASPCRPHHRSWHRRARH